MDIFESLENLNVSEECFDEIMGLVERNLNMDILNYYMAKDEDERGPITTGSKKDGESDEDFNRRLHNTAAMKSLIWKKQAPQRKANLDRLKQKMEDNPRYKREQELKQYGPRKGEIEGVRQI
jgi:hypothetical protein